VDSGSDLNAYAKVENQAGCCSPSMENASECCAPAASGQASIHEELTELLSKYDVNSAAASVKVYAIKPKGADATSAACCGPGCCS
jgi:arsenite methyltransferase